MSSNKPVRVRFAPSPTGYLHVGGIRSALFNWLWARHTGGKFILRIEDTDQSRYVEGATDQINESLEALGIVPDEGPRQGGAAGPYVQSERLQNYSTYAGKLVKTGALYPCWCSPERLATLREAAQLAGVAFKYDRHCLIQAHQRSIDEPHVLRFMIPDHQGAVGWDDAVRGHLEVQTGTLDDFVAIKADGFPTYQFANVIDDHAMGITHVLRADEWLPSTPKHLLLYRSLGWEPPVFAHLPAVLGPTGGKKLSKRDGAQSVMEYLAEGYLPEALMSFLATLGWNDGTTQEVYTPLELIEKFTLDRIQKSPAKFDKDRLTWVNGVMIRGLTQHELLERSRLFWPEAAEGADDSYKREILRLVHERLKTLSQIPELTEFFFTDPTPTKELLLKGMDAESATQALTVAREALEQTTSWTEPALEQTIRPLTDALGLKTGQFFGLIRVAITGRTAAPGLFETIAALGKDRTLNRLAKALTQI
jgi:glutamyl-tRNA synthetase